MTNTPGTPNPSGIYRIASQTASKLVGYPIMFEWHPQGSGVYVLLRRSPGSLILDGRQISADARTPMAAKVAVAAWVDGYAKGKEDATQSD